MLLTVSEVMLATNYDSSQGASRIREQLANWISEHLEADEEAELKAFSRV